MEIRQMKTADTFESNISVSMEMMNNSRDRNQLMEYILKELAYRIVEDHQKEIMAMVSEEEISAAVALAVKERVIELLRSKK